MPQKQAVQCCRLFLLYRNVGTTAVAQSSWSRALNWPVTDHCTVFLELPRARLRVCRVTQRSWTAAQMALDLVMVVNARLVHALYLKAGATLPGSNVNMAAPAARVQYK